MIGKERQQCKETKQAATALADVTILGCQRLDVMLVWLWQRSLVTVMQAHGNMLRRVQHLSLHG
jgi:hypothetical protein